MADAVILLPVMLPLGGAVIVAFLQPRAAAWIVVMTTAATLAGGVLLAARALTDGPQTYHVGGWAPPHGIVLVGDSLGASLAALAALLALAAASYTLAADAPYARRQFYHPLFLLLLTALDGVFLTGDLFNMYVFMELVILASFGLVAMSNRQLSAEVTFKYAVLAALGSTVLLIAVGFVYASVGTLNMADIAVRIRTHGAPPLWPAAAALLLFAFLLKGAILPFHFWQPDAHSTAPAPISAMLSGVLVKVCVYGVLRMQTLLFPDAAVLGLLAPLGAVSALFGGLAALASTDIKRLLAYSTISNMGFILVALGWGGPAGWLAALVNTLNHAVIKGGLFLTGGHIAETADEHDMKRLGAVGATLPHGAVAFGIGAVALAGLPPLNGFWSKATLFSAGLASGDATMLAATVVASAIGIAYAARAFLVLFRGGALPGTGAPPSGERPATAGPMLPEPLRRRWPWASPLALATLCVIAGAWPGPVVDVGRAIAAELATPRVYIEAVMGVAP